MKELSLPLPTWLQEEGPSSDTVLATKTCLSRNLSNVPFLPTSSEEHLAEVASNVTEALEKLNLLNQFTLYSVEKLPSLALRFFEEEGTLPEDFPREQRYLYIERGGRTLITVNVVDHVRIESRYGGLRVEEGFRAVKELDLKLEQEIEYAFSLEWGYLTTRLEDVGSGLSIKVLLHLPGLVLEKELESTQQTLKEEGFLLRPLFLSTKADNETIALGELYLLEDLRVAGRTEEEVCKKLEERVGSLVHYEREKRQTALKEERIALEDKIYRAWGVLERARVLRLEEALDMLSLVRFGSCVGMLPVEFQTAIPSLMLESCPAHVWARMQEWKKGVVKKVDEETEALERARYINHIFSKLEKGRERV
ncbi:MAG: hypothetical protein SNJ78_06945 [Spirochaetales bacterium]